MGKIVDVKKVKEFAETFLSDIFLMFCHRLKKGNGKPEKYNFCEDHFCSYGERKDGDGNG